MGDIWQQDKLLLFLAFFIPGFIAMQVYSLFIATGERDFTKQLPEAVAYSAIHYALVGWIIIAAPAGLPRSIAAYVVVLVLPMLWAPVILLVRNWNFYSKRILTRKVLSYLVQPEATPWDKVFADPNERWIRIKLKSGNFVGGVLAIGSETSAYPCPNQVYVREEWECDASGFIDPIPNSRGLLINGTEMEYLELFVGEETNDE